MENFKFVGVSKTLIMSAAFERELSNVDSAEYKLYTRMLSEIPGLIVVRKTHTSPTYYKNKETGRKT